jgi:rubrerythrin
MDFRDLLNKLNSIQTEVSKDDFEPREKPSSQELMQHVSTLQFTQPTASQAKYSIANSVKFQGKDVNDPKTKVELFKDAMQNTPGLLFSEISTRIKPTDDAQMEISQKFLDASREIDNNGKPAAEDIKLLMAVINKAVKEMSLERDADQSKYDDNADDTEESISSALNNLDSEVDEGDDPKELDFDNDTWPLAGGDFPDYWYCDNCGKAASGGGSCPECGHIREMTESVEITEAPMAGNLLDADVADVFGSADKFIRDVENSFKDGNVKVEKEPINTNNKKLPNPTKSLRVLWDKEPIKRGNGYWQAIQWADGSIHYVPMADDGTPIWTGEVPNTMRNTYKQKGFGLSTSNGGKYVQKGAVWMTREQDIDNKMKQADADAKASDQRNKVYDLQTLYVLNQMGYNSIKAAQQAHDKMSPAEQEKMESEFEAGMAKAPTDMETLKTAPSKKTAKGSDADVQAAIELLKSKGYDVSKKEGDLDDPTTKIPQTGSKPKVDKPTVISTDIHSEGKKAKPDFLDVDNDKNKKETFKKALKDKEKQKESVNEEVADKQDALKHLQKLMLMPSIMKNKEMFNKIKARYNQLRANESVEGDVQESWFNDLTDVTLNGDEFYEAFGWIGIDEDAIEEAEYQGRKVKLGKPMRGDVKKFKVYVKNPKGNVVKVNFGDPDMKIKKSNPARRKSFRARHNCDSPGPRHKARYWSCRKW